MSYFLNLFSVETWRAFSESGKSITGFSKAQRTQAERNISPNDIFLCYVVGLSRWVGALRIASNAFTDDKPIFRRVNDPFTVRFKVEPLVTLDFEYAIPVTNPEIWRTLSWTKEIEPGSVGWGANFQRSLRQIPDVDANFILHKLNAQLTKPVAHPFDAADLRKLRQAAVVQTESGAVTVEIPTDEIGDSQADGDTQKAHPEIRESHKIQALLAEIGAKMGFKIWLPKSDRERVLSAGISIESDQLVEVLPMNYNEATVRTIEQIDVIWLKGRSIARAFEVEHTTAIYSGLLRMADLLALQPNLHIPLHIVAPEERRASVLEQIRRPVFSLLDTGPLGDRCTLLSYDNVRQISSIPHLQHTTDSIIEDFETFADV